MSQTDFPNVGQFFGVTFADGTDRSYREDIWECIACDEHRIVATAIDHIDYKKAIVFYRKDWIIQPVSDAIVAAIQIKVEAREQRRAEWAQQ